MKPDAVLVDVDGTLCDVTTIRHLVLGRTKHFDAFHYGSSFCPPIEWVAEEVRNHSAAGKQILIVTARERRWELLTSNWMDSHDIPFDEMYMRPNGDFRPDYIIKAEMLDLIVRRFVPVHAYDDNPNIIRLWRERELSFTHVPGWAAEEAA